MLTQRKKPQRQKMKTNQLIYDRMTSTCFGSLIINYLIETTARPHPPVPPPSLPLFPLDGWMDGCSAVLQPAKTAKRAATALETRPMLLIRQSQNGPIRTHSGSHCFTARPRVQKEARGPGT